MRAVFPEDTLAILPGVRAQDFSTLPYDHLIFTGSADAGRTVMRSAAENLTPVTLELGGKSPTILCDDFDVDEAASRILYAKYLNAGQTCLAPDYLFLPESKRDAFVAAAKRIMPQRYPDTNQQSYTSVIDAKSYRRLRATLDDARQKGADVISLVPGMSFNDELRKIPPHMVLGVTDDMTIMQDEIFGPLLPVKTYKSLDEVIAYVNGRDRPLGFYVFTNDAATQDTARLLDHLGRRDGEQLHAARRPARHALRRHRRQRHGPLPRLRGLPRVLEAAPGVQESTRCRCCTCSTRPTRPGRGGCSTCSSGTSPSAALVESEPIDSSGARFQDGAARCARSRRGTLRCRVARPPAALASARW